MDLLEKRLRKESRELRKKISVIEEFFKTEKFEQMKITYQSLLIRQHAHMSEYAKILEERILLHD